MAAPHRIAGPSSSITLKPIEIEHKAANPPPLTCLNNLTGKRAELLKALYMKGIIDAEGNIGPEYSNILLPSLNEEETKLIRDELEKVFSLTIDEKFEIETSFDALLKSLIANNRFYQLSQARIIGGYVTYLLFTKTKYAERVFKILNISELYDPSIFQDKPPHHDIDVRMHVENANYPYTVSYVEFQYLKELVINQLAAFYIQKHPKVFSLTSKKVVQEKIQNQVFDDLVTVVAGNCFQLLSFKNSSFDWIIFNRLTRFYVFTLDDLFLPLDSLILTNTSHSLNPESNRGKPLESFFHYFLGLIKTDSAKTLDEKAWFRFISWIIKGSYAAEPHLEETLYLNTASRLFPYKDLGRLPNEIKKWIKKHHQDPCIASFAFLFNFARFTKNRLAPEQINQIFHSFKCDLENAHPIIDKVLKLVFEHRIPLNVIESFLQITCFLISVRKSTTDPEISVEIGLQNFDSNCLQFFIKDCAIQLDFEVIEAIQTLMQFSENSLLWKQEVESLFFELFFFLTPLHDKKENYLTSSLLEELEKGEHFLRSPCSLLQYIGLLFADSSPPLKKSNQNLVNTISYKLYLKLLSVHPNKEGISKQFSDFLEEKIPQSSEPDFEKNWITLLFEKGRKAESTALEIWKKWIDSDLQKIQQTNQILKNLIHYQPEFALLIFNHLTQEVISSSKRILLIPIIIDLTQTISHIERNENHNQFLDFLGQFLIKTLTSEGRALKEQKRFSQALLWFAKWSDKRGEFKKCGSFLSIGFEAGYFLEKEIREAEKLRLKNIFFLLQAEKKPLKQDRLLEVYGHLKNAYSKDQLPDPKYAENLLALIIDSSKDMPVLEVFQDFLKAVCLKKIPKANYALALEQILLTLEGKSSNLIVYHCGLMIEETIDEILTESIPNALLKRVLLDCKNQKLKFIPSGDLWLKVLESWILEKDLEILKDLVLIEDLFQEGYSRGFRNKALSLSISSRLILYLSKEPSNNSKIRSLIAGIHPDDQPIYFQAVEEVIKHKCLNLKDLFSLIDKILKSTEEGRKLLFDPILKLCNEACTLETEIETLAGWLIRSDFFKNNEEEEALIFSKCFELLTNNLKEKGSNKKITGKILLTMFLKKQECLSEDSLNTFLKEMLILSLSDGLEIFKKIRFSERHSAIYLHGSYVHVLSALVSKNDNRILAFLENYAKDREFFCTYLNPDILDFLCHSYLLEGASMVLDKTNRTQYIRIVNEILVNSVLLFESLTANKKNDIKLQSTGKTVSDIVYLQISFAGTSLGSEMKVIYTSKAVLDVSYLKILFSSSDPNDLKEGKTYLQERYTEQYQYPNEYWVYYMNLINYLVSTKDPRFAEIIFEILETVNSLGFKFLKLEALINYLLEQESLGMILKAESLLRRDILADWKPDVNNWALIKRLFLKLNKFSNNESLSAVTRLMFAINPHITTYKELLGDSFHASLLHFNLRHYAFILDQQCVNNLMIQIIDVYHNLYRLYPHEEQLIYSFLDANITLITLRPISKDIKSLCDKLFNHFVVAHKKFNNKKLIQLSKEKYFRFKITFLKKLKKIQNVNPETISEVIEEIKKRVKEALPEKKELIDNFENLP